MKQVATINSQRKEENLSTKSLALSGILVGIGFVIHAVVPPLFMGIKPDFLLVCMFVAILVNPHIKNAAVVGIVAGIVAALTTGFPGGQLPSLVDKFASAIFVCFLIKAIPHKISKSQKMFLFVSICFVGTVVSGVVFLGSALVIAGLPVPMFTLIAGIVLPTAIANAGVGVLLYKIQNIANPS